MTVSRCFGVIRVCSYSLDLNHESLRRSATAWTRDDRRRRRSGRCAFWQTKVRQQPALFIERHPNLGWHWSGRILAGDSSFRSFRTQMQRHDDAPDDRHARPGFRAWPQPGTPPRRGPRFRNRALRSRHTACRLEDLLAPAVRHCSKRQVLEALFQRVRFHVHLISS